MGFSFDKSMGCPGDYDDGITLSMIWRTLAPALRPRVRYAKPVPGMAFYWVKAVPIIVVNRSVSCQLAVCVLSGVAFLVELLLCAAAVVVGAVALLVLLLLLLAAAAAAAAAIVRVLSCSFVFFRVLSEMAA